MRFKKTMLRRMISRRSFLKKAGSLAVLPLAADLAGCAPASDADEQFNSRLVLLGTAGGPSWWPASDRMGASSALVIRDPFKEEERIYLVDLGYGALQRLAQAFNEGKFIPAPGGPVQKGYSDYMAKVKALFFTHLHMDHLTDLPALLLYGQGVGLKAYPDDEADKRLQIHGPGTRGQLEDVFPPKRPIPPIINPDNPTPGTADMVDMILPAFAQTINNFTRDNGWGNFSELVGINEIPFPPLPRSDYPIDPNTGQPLNTAPWPDMDPIFIYRDDLIYVTATLVNHGPVYPCLAYRFDTADGSVVFSGDTGFPCNNLVQLAFNADILVHEVIDPVFIDNLFPKPLSPGNQALKYHLESAHTAIADVGRQATDANVRTLVLNHIVPGNTPVERLRMAGEHFNGRLIIGEDLKSIGLNPQ
jgi:ribonuclease BN (tRNA processing enzyme)